MDPEAEAGEQRDAAEVVARERQLLDPAVRAAPEAVRALLHPDFVEFGSSGRVWDLGSIVAELETVPGAGGDPVELRDPVTTRLGEDAILLTYTAWTPSRSSLRSSVWVREGGDWRLRFHQGTARPS